MKKVSLRCQQFYSCFSGDVHELYVVELDGIHVDSFSHYDEAYSFARGFSVALKVCGNEVKFDYTTPLDSF